MDNRYFKRDISWLSFNYRVLLEAEDETLPLYERINFISIYSSNLEEFYKIRVADHKAIATGASQSDEETMQSAAELVDEINQEVNRQLEERIRIYEQKILPAPAETSHHILSKPQRRTVSPRLCAQLLPRRDIPLSGPGARKQGQGDFIPARQPSLSSRTASSERSSRQFSKPHPVFRDETAVQQSAALHPAAQGGERLLSDVH